jgi:UDP-2,4-diacetamido-2,4,6-trideoxy-beta-L-altropyranose hydrolase
VKLSNLSKPFGKLRARKKYKIIVAKSNRHLRELESTPLPAQTELLIGPDSIANLYRSAQLYIGSGGTVTWERMICLLPGLVTAVADNQVPASQALAEDGYQEYLGLAQELDYSQAILRAEDLVNSPSGLTQMTSKMKDLVAPFQAHLLIEASQGLRVRKARASDTRFLYELRKDPVVAAMFISGADFSFESHVKWVESTLAKGESRLYIVLEGQTPRGQVRVDADGGISVSLHESARGRGLGAKALSFAISMDGLLHSPHRKTYYALVKTDNPASQKIFLKVGFGFSETTQLNGITYNKYLYPAP